MDVTPISAAPKKPVVERDFPAKNPTPIPTNAVAPSSAGRDSGSDSDSSSSDTEAYVMKKRKIDAVLPVGFLDPLSPEERRVINDSKKAKTAVDEEKSKTPESPNGAEVVVRGSCKQFWKAGDYEGHNLAGDSSNQSGVSGGMDHLRVHPRFLHSNATSHKWALGALAELLDNSLDEVCNGATYVNVDVILNQKDSSKMLFVEDDGGGMTPDKLRQCMSLGYSLKSKLANTIGQYGNGFKTSTMRLGADVIVFSRCLGTQSIGMLSYTFLTKTGKEDIVVPMIDYKRDEEGGWEKLIRSSSSDWSLNLETILKWSPYSSEEELLEQFNGFKAHGTKIVIYNLWEDDEGMLELDFDADESDIQMRGANRDEEKIEMAKIYPNSKHFLTYRHSLRSYASILYLRIPPGYRMILRGKEIEHHNVVDDLFLTKELTYRPVITDPSMPKNDPNMVATGTIGFVKDARRSHFDIQGFNVYHKNRLIKPFWRVWNAAGSDGRGVIGVLEANFVEPAHDKQGFERTTALARLEAKLTKIQKDFWSTNCQEIGYAPRRNKKAHSIEAETTPPSDKDKSSSTPPTKKRKPSPPEEAPPAREVPDSAVPETPPAATRTQKSNAVPIRAEPLRTYQRTPYPLRSEASAKNSLPNLRANQHTGVPINAEPLSTWKPNGRLERSPEKAVVGDAESVEKKKVVWDKVTKSEKIVENLERILEVEQEKCKELERKLELAEQKIEAMDKEHETLIDIFSEERSRRDAEEDELRQKLQDASRTIQELLDKVNLLEGRTAK